MYGTDALVSVPSRGEESNNFKEMADEKIEAVKVSVPSRGKESNNFANLSNKQLADLEFPSPLGVKSPTICKMF